MTNKIFVSICIPSYNRPVEIKRLLDSIDTKCINEVQVVICEDNAPKRFEVRRVVEDFIKNTIYKIKYIENIENLGHGKNLRECIKQADGEYIIFMGDDDMFIPEAFDVYLKFIKNHKNCGYILRSSRQLLKNGKFEYFKYYNDDKFFSPGFDAYIQVFLKSVFMSGFTIKRDLVKNYTIDCLDDTLLFQLYLAAEVCLKYPSAYCNTPFVQGVGDGISYFGTNEKEKQLYTPGVLVTNNINFINSFLRITATIDEYHNINSTDVIRHILSKYSFPLMYEARKSGIIRFNRHCDELRKMGLNSSIYYNIYYSALLLLGAKSCKSIVRIIKKIYGRRVEL
jgi:abequosyltransferase